MIITTKHSSSLNFGGFTLIVLELCPFINGKVTKNLFPFSYLSLPQPNVTKLIHNADYHKTQLKIEFWWRHFNHYQVMIVPQF